jgi:hypothetical protein
MLDDPLVAARGELGPRIRPIDLQVYPSPHGTHPLLSLPDYISSRAVERVRPAFLMEADTVLAG